MTEGKTKGEKRHKIEERKGGESNELKKKKIEAKYLVQYLPLEIKQRHKKNKEYLYNIKNIAREVV